MHVIKVSDARKKFGSKLDTKVVLNNFNMKVERGSIYALMGSSGCGKTTLISCIVGIQSLDGGHIDVLNDNLGKSNSNIGYMPQETALVSEFSIKEMINLYGIIFGMKSAAIAKRLRFLSNLLDLPDEHRFIRDCSGGQQRRVSFALTLIHEPEILILDEPTVGVDPLLRSKIWDYLIELTTTKNVTVLLSTHYIEEARQSTHVGLMRNGVQIAEDSPQNILSKCGTTSLEDAFFKLSEQQENDYSNENVTESHHKSSVESYDRAAGPSSPQAEKHRRSNIKMLKALLIKNALQFVRHPGGILSALLLPFFSIICMNYTIGGNVTGMVLGIVNNEVGSISECFNTSLVTAKTDNYECILDRVSCRFINQINETVAIKKYYNSFDEAFEDAKHGRIIGFIQFASNFTKALTFFNDEGVEKDFTDSGIIQVFLDQTDIQKTSFITRKIYEVYRDFARGLLGDCNKSKEAANLPITFEAYYGTLDSAVKYTLIPGIILAVFFSVASYLTSLALIEDRLGGVWNRFAVAGVKPYQFLISHLISGSCLMFLQALEFIIFAIYLSFEYSFNFIMLISLLLILMGLCGVIYGLMISVLTDSTLVSSFASLLALYPFLCLSGILWPFEGVPRYFHFIGYIVPFTLPTKTFINLLFKNLTIFDSQVFLGYLVLSGWISVQLAICFWCVRPQEINNHKKELKIEDIS